MKNDKKWSLTKLKKETKTNESTTVETNNTEEQEMAKKEEQATEKVFTRFMVGTHPHPTTGEWMLSYIAYNPATGDIGELQTERVSGDYEIMRERLMIKQTQLGLYDTAAITEPKKTEIY